MNCHFELFVIPGQPMGKGRPRFSMVKGRAIAYTDSETKAYEKKVRDCYLQSGGTLHDGQIAVCITAFYKIPSSSSKSKKSSMLEGKSLPTVRPDIDNVAKSVLDGLLKVAYPDDSRVVSLIVRKLYGEPRVEVKLWEINN